MTDNNLRDTGVPEEPQTAADIATPPSPASAPAASAAAEPPVAAPAVAPAPLATSASDPAAPQAAASAAVPGAPAGAPVAGPTDAPALSEERPLRGLLFALPVIPVGIIAWVLLWQLGFISAIVAFGVSVAAVFLYRRGSGGLIGPAGLGVVAAVTLVTLALSFLGGLAYDLAQAMATPFPGSLLDPPFWDAFARVFSQSDVWGDYLPDLGFSLLFAVLGTFSVFRRLRREARASR